MKQSTFLLILTWFMSTVEFSYCNDILGDWENPNDIFGRAKSSCGTEFGACKEDLQHCRDELYALREENHCKGPRVVKQPSVADHYLKRFINVLLSSAKFKHRQLGEGNEMWVNLNLYFNSKTLSILQAFASDDTNGHSWSELDASFITVFDGDPSFRASYAPASNELPSGFSGNRIEEYHLAAATECDVQIGAGHFQNWMSGSHHHFIVILYIYTLTILIAVVSSIGFCVIWVYMTGSSLKSAFFVGAVLVVSFCFGWTWWSEVENQRMKFMVELSRTNSDQIPDSCKNPTSGWFGWFLKSSREEDCLKYLKARNVHPIAAVDLAHVFSKTLQTLIFSWLPALAKSSSDAIDLFFGTSWFGSIIGHTARIATGPMIVILIILALAVVMITRSSFRFKTFLWEIDYGSQKKLRPSLHQAEDETQYEELTDQEPNLAITSNGSQYSEAKRAKRVVNKIRRTKLHRSETVSLPLALDLPLLLRSPKQKGNRQMLPFEPLSKQRSEDKRFRELRRAYSVVERPTMDVDHT